MKMRFSALIFLLSVSALASGQSDSVAQIARPSNALKNALVMQLGGATGWYSVNYERYFRHRRLPGIYFLAGPGFFKLKHDDTKWRGSAFFVKTGYDFGKVQVDLGATRVWAHENLLYSGHFGGTYYSSTYTFRFTFFEAGISRVFRRRLVIGFHGFPVRVSDKGGNSDFLEIINMDAMALKKAGRNWVYWGSFHVGFMF